MLNRTATGVVWHACKSAAKQRSLNKMQGAAEKLQVCNKHGDVFFNSLMLFTVLYYTPDCWHCFQEKIFCFHIIESHVQSLFQAKKVKIAG